MFAKSNKKLSVDSMAWTPKGVFNSGKTTIYSEMTAIRPLYIVITTLSNNIRYCFGYYFGIKNLLQ